MSDKLIARRMDRIAKRERQESMLRDFDTTAETVNATAFRAEQSANRARELSETRAWAYEGYGR